MSQTKTCFNKLRIYNKDPGSVSTGANTIVELDGKVIGGCTFLKIELKPQKVAKVTIEMLAEIDDIELEELDLQHVSQKILRHDVPIISRYESKKI